MPFVIDECHAGNRSGFVPDRRHDGTVVVGDWAKADGGYGLNPVDHGEQELNGSDRGAMRLGRQASVP